jgi:hypothetical protein
MCHCYDRKWPYYQKGMVARRHKIKFNDCNLLSIMQLAVTSKSFSEVKSYKLE